MLLPIEHLLSSNRIGDGGFLASFVRVAGETPTAAKCHSRSFLRHQLTVICCMTVTLILWHEQTSGCKRFQHILAFCRSPHLILRIRLMAESKGAELKDNRHWEEQTRWELSPAYQSSAETQELDWWREQQYAQTWNSNFEFVLFDHHFD